MPLLFNAEFDDTEELSLALRHTNVAAVQTSRGQFQGLLEQHGLGAWSLQYLRFDKGIAACAGDAPLDRYAFVIPMQTAQGCRLLGRPVTASSVAVYAPSSEHSDVTCAGHEQMVLVAPDDLLPTDTTDGSNAAAKRGSQHHHVPEGMLSTTLTLLREARAYSRTAESAEVDRALSDALSTKVREIIEFLPNAPTAGRPPYARSSIVKKIAEQFDLRDGTPIYTDELAKAVGVSHETLRRIFLERYGIAPARYLMLKRLYLARSRLRSGEMASVTEVAASCGFWEPSRFSSRYKALFGELPSQTMRRSGR